MNVSKTLNLTGHSFEINTVGDSIHRILNPIDRSVRSTHIMVPTELMLVKTIITLLEGKDGAT